MSLEAPVPAPATPPAGWYQDPHNHQQQRWWDGQRWTDHTSQQPQVTVNINAPSGSPSWGPGVAARPRPTVPPELLATGGQRFGAALLDTAVVFALWIAVGLFAGMVAEALPGGEAVAGLLFVAAFIGSFIYSIVYTANCGQTYGKHALGIEVRRIDDASNQIGVGATIGREILKGIGGYVFGLGLLWVLFDPQRQGWHDKAVRTVVVHTDRPRLPFSDFLMGPFRQR